MLEQLGRAALLRPPPPGDERSSRAGGWVAGLAYVSVARLDDVVGGVATMANLGGKEGVLAAGQGVGRALLPWLMALMIVEWLSKRRHAGTLVAPLVTAALAFRACEALALVEPASRLSFEVAGLLACAWLGVRARPPAGGSARSSGSGASSDPETSPEDAATVEETTCTLAEGRRAFFMGAGALVLCGSVGVGATDARRLWRRWDSLGPLARGAQVPPFRARTLAGDVFDRASLTGAPTMLVFWATWCGYCARQMPAIERIHRAFQGRGLRVVGVNTDRAADQAAVVRGYVEEKGLSFPQVLDTGRVARAFRNSMLPHVVFVDEDGEIVRVFQGKTGEQTLLDVVAVMIEGASHEPR